MMFYQKTSSLLFRVISSESRVLNRSLHFARSSTKVTLKSGRFLVGINRIPCIEVVRWNSTTNESINIIDKENVSTSTTVTQINDGISSQQSSSETTSSMQMSSESQLFSSASEVQAQTSAMPEATTPNLATSETTTPNLATSETTTPNLATSETTTPNLATSEATTPDTATWMTLDASPTTVEDVTSMITEGGYQTLVSQGLGGWSPSGLVQTALETMHITCDIPWWLTIVVGTCILRVAMFPLVILAQRNAARMNNHLPQMQLLQLKMAEARRTGNALLAANYAQQLMLFMKEKNLNPLKSMIVPLAQAPVFISVFFGLRGMANLPLESMKTGGIYWFTNLTIPDPLYLLPLLTSATLLVTLEVGAEGGIRAQNMQLMRYFLRAFPLLIFPFTINFPAAILCYWTTSNFISLCQVAILKYPPIRKYFNIERLIHHSPETLPIKQKGFVDNVKETYTNSKIVKELEDRTRFDEMQFRKAGIGPIQKTYSYDPTKQTKTSATAASAKPRET